MKWKITDLKTRFDIMGAIILVAGLLCSLCIYLTADDVVENLFGNELDESKKYIRSLELYGGKANVLATELTQWFNGLWHGKNLAFTIGFITIVISFCFFLADYYSDSGSNNKRLPN